METAWKLVPLRQIFPLKVVPLIEVLLYTFTGISTAVKYSIKERPLPQKPLA
jgi:hypothetical protein